MRAPSLLLVTCLFVGSCGSPDPEPVPASERRSWVGAIDARRVPEDLRDLSHPDGAVRARALRFLGQLRSEGQVESFQRGLADPDPQVRREASRALGALSGDAAWRSLLGRLAQEGQPDVRARLLHDLGRTGGKGIGALLLGSLEKGSSQERAGACRGLAARFGKGDTIPGAQLRMAERLRDPVSRRACAFALSRMPAPADAEESRRVGEALRRHLGTEDADVRRFLVKALGHHKDPLALEALAGRTSDPDWRVAVQAFRSLGGSDAETLAPVVRRRLERALAPDVSLPGPESHGVLAAVHAARVSRATGVLAAAKEARTALQRRKATRDLALLDCHLAQLVAVLDAPSLEGVLSCGLGL
ncbi:MAG: HEAT repeat domain-containing protein, partial [Myxococcales bacterium]|nr:HEAT repeat domain-containing protein [Myxococcales bacterium]